MATYILFWNPDISSYTKDRFLDDFSKREGVGNWSFYEHNKVKDGDNFFMVKCGEGKTGIVMRGKIISWCYRGRDWSPKDRQNIYYADIDTGVCFNPWSDVPLLAPDILTEAIPDFNWHGGHSGRLLSIADANKLEKLWAEYIDCCQTAFCNKKAWHNDYYECIISKAEATKLVKRHGCRCEICGYSYEAVFGGKDAAKRDSGTYPVVIRNLRLKRLLFNICRNCNSMPEEIIAQKLIEQQESNDK